MRNKNSELKGASLVDYSSKATKSLNLTDGIWTQRLVYSIALIAWVVFIQSALTQDYRPWFEWLLTGRIIMASAAAILLAATFFPKIRLDLASPYFIFCAAIQSSYACLEPADQIEFYKFVSYLILLSCISFSGHFKRWLKFSLFPSALSLTTPLFFKSIEMFSSVGRFTFSFTETVSVVFIAAVVLRLVTSKYDALFCNLQLKDQLLESEINAHVVAQKKLEEMKSELIESAKYQAIARCMQMVSHDVRTPLSLVKIAMDIFANASNQEELLAAKDAVCKEIEVASNQVDGLLQDIMNVGNDRLNLSLETVDAARFLDLQVKRSLLGTNFARDRIHVEVQHGLTLVIDEGKFSRVIANLLSNAIQAIRTGTGSVHISAFQRNGQHLVTVKNTGSFIAPEDRTQIFRDFFTKGKKNGTGLGLLIVKTIVEAHKGVVECLSGMSQEHPEGFVEFRISLGVS
jgi:signal transduction histidine kinase